jgi:hypothetical protein
MSQYARAAGSHLISQYRSRYDQYRTKDRRLCTLSKQIIPSRLRSHGLGSLRLMHETDILKQKQSTLLIVDEVGMLRCFNDSVAKLMGWTIETAAASSTDEPEGLGPPVKDEVILRH